MLFVYFQKCPLCQSDIRLFFINYNEKFLMCENTECEFPFGYEELQFVTIDNDMAMTDMYSALSGISLPSPRYTASGISQSGMSEMERINQMYESADENEVNEEQKIQKKELKKANKEKYLKKKLKKESDEKIRKHLEDIDSLHKELLSHTSPQTDVDQIRNEKWIRKLKSLQEASGVADLVKPEEMQLLKKEEPALGLGELKIDIDPGDSSSMSTIKIAIQHAKTEETM